MRQKGRGGQATTRCARSAVVLPNFTPHAATPHTSGLPGGERVAALRRAASAYANAGGNNSLA